MKQLFLLNLLVLFMNATSTAQSNKIADTTEYLSSIKHELTVQWPKNRTINLVFHGHSVPAGYWHNHEVHTLESYPYLLFKKIKEQYPYAVVNMIVTAIGGENSDKGQARFDDVLAVKPDVLFIDYALNDRGIGLAKAKESWEKMIHEAIDRKIKVILLTPSPDQRADMLAKGNELEAHAGQVRELAMKYHIGLTDSFSLFQKIKKEEGDISGYMSHINHPNKKGHQLIADALFSWFRN
ncbi:SGNH/GDSL hydrolase family protein [Segetibacter sp.]|uniref:SGNH/GDSL hydrolase family protein n=1 Tax=Segetibacter sp. TaxID=2231182 RepID=UPI00262F812B|nr:SGNH/GDSL hydrolase family protein [Segetibacter sp.]MCW3079694.1 lysophospholipase L1-like esterase [Segetibacter sp.]